MTPEAEKILNALRERGRMTKHEMCIALGRLYSPRYDRQVRRYIAEIALEYPVISTSDNTGYELAEPTEEYRGLLEHQKRENLHRAMEILKRNEPIEKALEEIHDDDSRAGRVRA